MRFVSFLCDGTESYGLLHGNGTILDLPKALHLAGKDAPESLIEFIESGDDTLNLVSDLLTKENLVCLVEVASTTARAPLPRPVRLRDASLFLEHMEASLAKIGKPLDPAFKSEIIFYNANHLVVHGTDAKIAWPAQSDWIDYELELACVIGKWGYCITADEARDHIFGFTVFNDWSARDLQIDFMKAGLGPSGGKDFANSLGPCIVTLDEFRDIYDLKMTARINGEVWSSGTTGTMFHRWEEALAAFSQLSPLVPGEVIGSGTVLNGCGFELDRRLQVGDEVQLEIEGIGILRNTIVRG